MQTGNGGKHQRGRLKGRSRQRRTGTLMTGFKNVHKEQGYEGMIA